MTARHVSTAALAALVTAGIGISATPARADADPSIHYALTTFGNSVRTDLDGGTFALTVDGQSVEVRDSTGQPLDAVPLAVFVGDQRVAVTARLDDENRTLTLTPDTTGLEIAALRPIASPVEDQAALTELASNLSRGPLIGTVIGMAVGAVIGGILGLSTCALLGPACVATVPAAVAVFAAAGGMAGTVVGGGAALVAGVQKYLITLQSAPGASPYANNGLVNPDGTGVPDAILRLPSGSANGIRTGSSSGSAGR
ncbi:hypothetical protein ABZ540_31300 [Nocardia xishanensis]|uniref:hypothetical protein n=1 Tax=Nocardia xishanensis TaxID=238964 RepID=UPI0033CD2377